MSDCNCRLAGPGDMEAVYEVRRRVFCAEQGLFAVSDRDEWDTVAIHLVAVREGEIIGTVRLYEREPGLWVGGRLAVLPDHRGSAGFRLVRRAVEEADRRGAGRFVAAVQTANEKFFQRLGWRVSGRAETVNGVAHVLMRAPLRRGAELHVKAS